MKTQVLRLSMLLMGAAAGLAALQADDSATPYPPEPVIDALFADYDRPGAPGCALGVIRDGEFIYRRGYGMANLEFGIPLGPRSVFRIGSTSKQFTATAIALLSRAGQLDLDAPISRHFPEFPAWAGSITTRHLLLHTSGIRDYLELAFLAGKGDDADHYSNQWVLDLLARQRETNFPPGQQFLYSNSGYLLLAHLVERVSGRSLREFAQARIFGPLGMDHTHFHDDHREIVPNRASGYAPEGEGYRISMTSLDLVGDGGVFTTVDDLLAWDRNFYDNRLGGGAALIRELTTPGALSDGEPLEYAFGLGIHRYRGLPAVSHEGAFVGFRAQLLRFPEQAFSAVVLCNRSDAAPDRLARRVADHYLADLLAPPEAATGPAGTLQLEAAQLRVYEGDYWEDGESFAAEVRYDEGRLWAVHSPTRRNELRPVAPDVFEMVGVPADVRVYFDRDGETVTAMRRTIDGEARGAFRPFLRRLPEAGELDGYAGAYYSTELDVTYRLHVNDGMLLFDLPDHPGQELTAMFGETFENPDYGAFEFRRAPGGQVTGFRLQSGRVRNLQFERSR